MPLDWEGGVRFAHGVWEEFLKARIGLAGACEPAHMASVVDVRPGLSPPGFFVPGPPLQTRSGPPLQTGSAPPSPEGRQEVVHAPGPHRERSPDRTPLT